jgi:PAS domain S-box-containing protein
MPILYVSNGLWPDVVENAPWPVVVIGPEGGVEACNRAFCALAGVATEEALHGRNWCDMTHPGSRPDERSALAVLAATGLPQVYEKDLVIDGVRVPVRVRVHAAGRSLPGMRYAFVEVLAETALHMS